MVGIAKYVKLIAVIVAVVMISAGALIAAWYLGPHTAPSGRLWSDTHISIHGDNEFALSNATQSGSGTESDPYILSNASVRFTSGIGIDISNTTAHFVLKDVLVVFQDMSGGCIRSSGIGVRIVNATNVLLSNLTLSNCDIEIKNCTALHISENTGYLGATIQGCSDGFVTGNALGTLALANCTGFVVSDNINLTQIELNDCEDTDVRDNVMQRGFISFHGCTRCRALSNTVNSISFDSGTADSQISHNLMVNGTYQAWGAVFLDDVKNITVDANVIHNCSYVSGIELMNNVTNCTLVRNNISGCYGGIDLRGASGCIVYHNNILSSLWSGGWILSDPLDCQYHSGGILDEQGWLNSWDSGYPGGGNYYFDYNGSDMYSGPSQDVPGADGIGDTPLVVYTYLPGDPGADRYPLMSPYSG